MSIWHKEVIKVNGTLKAYVEVQNDYTGAIVGGLREIHEDGLNKYVRADGNRVDVTEECNALAKYEETVKDALKFYKNNHY